MKLLKIISRISTSISVWLIYLDNSYALPPVDFVMQVVANTWIYISMWIALFATFIWSTYRLFQGFYNKYKIGLIIISLFIVILSGSVILKLTSQSEIDSLFKEKEINLIQWLYAWIVVKSDIQTNISFLHTLNLDSMVNSKYFITNDEFTSMLSSNPDDVFILDWREDIEYQMWHIPSAIQMRTADIKLENSWKDLPTDKIIIVTCWTGMRGKIIRDYITSKWFEARYLKDGIESWLDVGWKFIWEEDLNKMYPDEKYKFNMHPNDIIKYKSDGALIIDAREEYITSLDPLDQVLIISESNDSTKEINTLLNSIKPWEKVMVMCDDPINCYDANMIWVKLEERWIIFLGRFMRDSIIVD